MPHVLIMDDEEDLLDMVCFALPHYGLTTTCVLETTAFFARLSAKKPDAILMDIYLGNADGRDICKQIKADKDLSCIPVILYSAGYISEESIDVCMADEFVQKPFIVEELAAKLLELCK